MPPLDRAVLEKLTVSQLIKQLVAFYRTWRFISVFTTSRHLSLSWARLIQFTPSLPVSWYVLILASHLCLKRPGGVSLSLSWARLIQFTPSLPVSWYVLLLASHLFLKRPGGVSFLQDSSQSSVCISLALRTCHVPRPDHFLRFIYPIFGNECKTWSSSSCIIL